MALEDFGKPIKLNEPFDGLQSGNEMLTQFIKLKRKFQSPFKLITTLIGNKDADRFFCEEDLIYVFPKEAIQDLLTSIGAGDGGIVLFNAARIDMDSPGNPKGRPTLMAFPYAQSGDSLVRKQLASDNSKDGREHPGGGLTVKAIKHSATDDGFTILDEIKISDIKLTR